MRTRGGGMMREHTGRGEGKNVNQPTTHKHITLVKEALATSLSNLRSSALF